MPLLEQELTEKIIGACMEVSNELGCGFVESVYKKALMIVLTGKGLKAQAEAPMTVLFHGQVAGQFFADILVEDPVVLEIKAVKALTAEHEAQLMNYLKATGIKVGLLINFGKPRLEWKRIVC